MDTRYNKQHINIQNPKRHSTFKIIPKKETVEAQDVSNPPKVIIHSIYYKRRMHLEY